MQTIFVVDDDADLLSAMADVLATPRRRVRTFEDPLQALAALGETPVDLLITDLGMPWLNGQNVVLVARTRQPDLPVFLVSGHDRGADVARSQGVRFFKKPLDHDQLLTAVDAALREPRRA